MTHASLFASFHINLCLARGIYSGFGGQARDARSEWKIVSSTISCWRYNGLYIYVYISKNPLYIWWFNGLLDLYPIIYGILWWFNGIFNGGLVGSNGI